MRNEVIYEKLDRIEKMLRLSIDKPMKIDEAAEFTGIKKSTLYQMVFQKDHTAFKAHRKVFILLET